MYTLSSKLKLTAIIFMIVGAIGLIYAFIAAPSTIEEVKEMMADDASHGSSEMGIVDQDVEFASPEHAEGDHILADDHDNEHYEHLLHQLQNKPWAAVYIAAFFFFMIALGTLVFYALQYAAQAGWSPVLFRVMEGITAYLLPGSIIIFIILLLSGLHLNHLFIWMDPEVVAHDKIIQNKSGYLNVTFFLIRALIYLGGWNLFRYLLRRNSLRIDEDTKDNKWFKQNFKLSAGFFSILL